ncbi:hypothetical protein [Aureispira anguillae]|uniref:Uncharacterized protein n=1 Tax=Aureispira anguillae TaxID=2864201 RepID=A0A916DTB3_9BACT|nr:hypothetical protein [Aureispira anguillae]BDS13104.1 hypothetical protein AsAng_0038320 [Aureispira anguillae]
MIKKFLPRIYSGNNSLDARWFVLYLDEKGKKRKKYGNINRFNTLEERQKAAQIIAAELRRALAIRFQSKFERQIYKELELRKSTWRLKTYQCKKSKIGIFLKWMKTKEWTEQNVYNFFFEHLTHQRTIKESTYNDYIRHVKNALEWCQLSHLIEPIKKAGVCSHS